MKKKITAFLFILILQNTFAVFGVLSEKTGLGFSLGAGGYEVKGIYKLNNYFSTSLEYNYMGLENIVISSGDDDQEIESSGTLKISSAKGLLHFHPFGGGFRLTGGYVFNLSNISIEIEGDDIVLDEENPDTTTSDISGTIVINTGSSLPYVGVGWGYSYEDFIALDFTLGIQFIPKISGENLISYDVSMEATALDGMVDEVVSSLDPSSDNYDADLVSSIEDAGYDPEDVAEALESTAVQEAISGGDPFELYEVLESEGILEQFGIDISASIAKSSDDDSDNPFSSLPNPDDYMGDIQSQIDDLVEQSGLGMVQDMLGYAPLPIASFGFSIFFF